MTGPVVGIEANKLYTSRHAALGDGMQHCMRKRLNISSQEDVQYFQLCVNYRATQEKTLICLLVK